MTNRERADQLLAEAPAIAEDMGQALDGGRWNLTARRAQEVIELVVKGLLNEMGIEYPRIHDAAPLLGEALRGRGLQAEAAFLDWLNETSARLAEIRAPAFYHEIEVAEAEARVAAAAADRVLAFGRDLQARLRRLG